MQIVVAVCKCCAVCHVVNYVLSVAQISGQCLVFLLVTSVCGGGVCVRARDGANKTCFLLLNLDRKDGISYWGAKNCHDLYLSRQF